MAEVSVTEEPVVGDPAPSTQGGSSRSFWLALLLITVAALALRVGYVAFAKDGEPVLGDQIYYSAEGDMLAEGRGFADPDPRHEAGPSADHPPLTAIVAALGPLLSDDAAPDGGLPPHLMLQRFTMALVGTAVVPLMGLLGRRLAGERAGLLAALLAAGHPALWVNDGLVMSESLGALTVVAMLLAAYRYLGRRDTSSALLLGASVGLAALARSEALMFAAVLVGPLVLVARRRSLGPSARDLALAGLACVVVLAPWVGPNLVRFERPVTLSTNDGLTVLGTNCDAVWKGDDIGLWTLACLDAADSDGDGVDDLEEFVLGTDIYEGADPSVVSSNYRSAGFDYATDNLGRLPVVMGVRVLRVWGLWSPSQMIHYNEGEGREPLVSWLALVGYYLLVPFAVAGGLILRRRRVALWPLLSTVVCVTVTAALFYGIFRFRVPADLAMVVLAAVTLDALLTRRFPTLPSNFSRQMPSTGRIRDKVEGMGTERGATA